MNITLINSNQVVSKLVSLTAKKMGVSFSEYHSSNDIVNQNCELLLVDSSAFNSVDFGSLNSSISYSILGLIIDKGNIPKADFDFYLEKPFLPTELIDKISNSTKHVAQKSDDFALDEFGDASNSTDDLDFSNQLAGFDDEPEALTSTQKDDFNDDFGDLSLDNNLETPADSSHDDFDFNIDEPTSTSEDGFANDVGAGFDDDLLGSDGFNDGKDLLGDGIGDLGLDDEITPKDEVEDDFGVSLGGLDSEHEMPNDDLNNLDDSLVQPIDKSDFAIDDNVDLSDAEEFTPSKPSGVLDTDEISQIKDLLHEDDDLRLDDDSMDKKGFDLDDTPADIGNNFALDTMDDFDTESKLTPELDAYKSNISEDDFALPEEDTMSQDDLLGNDVLEDEDILEEAPLPPKPAPKSQPKDIALDTSIDFSQIEELDENDIKDALEEETSHDNETHAPKIVSELSKDELALIDEIANDSDEELPPVKDEHEVMLERSENTLALNIESEQGLKLLSEFFSKENLKNLNNRKITISIDLR